jgi:hypothetical protein
MVCAAVCLSHATTSTWFSILHPIERDGDGGFFYAFSLTLPSRATSHSTVVSMVAPLKESVNGCFS